jgi:hypothetical protein
MNKLNDDVIRLIITFLVPKKHCLLNASPRFTACFCVEKYINNINITKGWEKCTKDEGIVCNLCAQHSEDYSDWINITNKIKDIHKYAGHYIHFDTKKQANMSKPYIKKALYKITQSCCGGKGFLISKIE